MFFTMIKGLLVFRLSSLQTNVPHFYFLLIIFLFGPKICFPQTLTKDPYLIEPGTSETTIRWEFDSKIESVLNYGLKDSMNERKQAKLRAEKEGKFLYEVILEDLKQGSQYFYQVSYGNEKSPMASFKTSSKNQSSFDFVAMGDSRSNPEIFASILENMKENEPDLIISMGDLVARGGDMAEWDTYFFDVAGNVIDHIPLVSTLGDHEGENDEGELFRHFLRTDQSTEKQWFSFDFGEAHFISLDYRHPNNSEMEEWFVHDISSSDARWKFVYLHRPSYNLGGHRSTWGRDKWPELFSEHHVDIVFAGHSHIYERFYPMQQLQDPDSWPVTYITTGGAGAGLYDVTQHGSLAVAESVNHFVYIEIKGKTLKLKAIRKDKSIMDELTIIKKGKGHDPAYNALVQSQRSVNFLTSLSSKISIDLNYVPFRDYTEPYVMTLNSIVAENVPFRIELDESSAESYRMDPVEGILKAWEESKVKLEIYSKSENITISNRGRMLPELRLKLEYTYDSIKEKIISKPAAYWPDVY